MFNTIIPHKLFKKLRLLNVNTQMCKWILDFLLNRTQVVRFNSQLSEPLTLSTGAPQGCVLSPLLFTLFTNDCRSSSSSTLIFKFSNDTTIEGLITKADESAYREEIERVVDWCTNNDLELNVAKTKEMIIAFRKNKTAMPPLATGEQFELVDSFKFLGTTIANTLKWDINAEIIAKKDQQRMFFLRQLKKFRVNKTILTQFYRAVIESVLTFSFTVWFGSASIHTKNMLEGIVKTASKITGSKLPSIESIYTTRTLHKATTIISDCTHPANHLFESLPSGKRFRSIKTRTTRFSNSFYPKADKPNHPAPNQKNRKGRR